MSNEVNSKYSIGVYAFYFGAFPDWMPLYVETLRRNPTVDFHIFTDCKYAGVLPNNVYLHNVVFDEYLHEFGQKLNVDIKADSPIKLCDLRPMIGYVLYDVFAQYDFYGWIDLDLLLGDIRSFYTDEILSKYDVFSTHSVRIAGHFSLFRNTKKNRMMFRRIYRWKYYLEQSSFEGLDEHGITNAYLLTVFDKFNQKYKAHIDNCITRLFSRRKTRKLYMVEQYTTPFTPIPWLDGSVNSSQPDKWFYKDGVITNSRDVPRHFMYIHFMNFKTDVWRHDGTKAPWKSLNKICNAVPSDMNKGIVIDCNGINPIE